MGPGDPGRRRPLNPDVQIELTEIAAAEPVTPVVPSAGTSTLQAKLDQLQEATIDPLTEQGLNAEGAH